MVRNIKVTYSDEDFKLLEDRKNISGKNWDKFIFDSIIEAVSQ